ncbi:VOC family protein [Nocardia sp. NBC_00403]|uniref:VOC family protein n=1 Tax=Nocardia sp. NBC_00403 TaxID=2975990 RepID=UPI002E1B4324
MRNSILASVDPATIAAGLSRIEQQRPRERIDYLRTRHGFLLTRQSDSWRAGGGLQSGGSASVHLDLAADTDLNQCQLRALPIGTKPAPTQPDPRWRVLLDSAGHPFRIATYTPPPLAPARTSAHRQRPTLDDNHIGRPPAPETRSGPTSAGLRGYSGRCGRAPRSSSWGAARRTAGSRE